MVKGLENKKPIVLFADVEAGFGHLAPMSAIVNEFTKKYQDKVQIVHKSVFTSTTNPHILKLGRMQSKHPERLGKNFIVRLGESITYAFPSRLMLFILDRVFGRGRKEYIKELGTMKPDVVVSTYYLPTHLCVQSNKKGLTNALNINYSPDTFIYPAWDRGVDKLFVNNERAYLVALKRGFKKSNVEKVGFVYKADAFNEKSQSKAREELGISEQEYVILITTGAYGTLKTVKLVKELVKKGVKVNIQVVCGKDKKTFDELTAIKNSGVENLQVYSQVQSLATLMQACDLIIGKAGANTTSEARLYSKPMIIFFEQSRIEVEQAKYLCDKKCVIREKKISKIISLITQDTLRKGHLRSKLVGLDENVVDGVTQVVDGIYEMMKDKGLTE